MSGKILPPPPVYFWDKVLRKIELSPDSWKSVPEGVTFLCCGGSRWFRSRIGWEFGREPFEVNGGGEREEDCQHPDIPAGEQMGHVGEVDATLILVDFVAVELLDLEREEETDEEADCSAAIFLGDDHEPADEEQWVGEECEVAIYRAEEGHEEHNEAGVVDDRCAGGAGILDEAGGIQVEREQKQREADADDGKTNTAGGNHAEKCIAGVICCRIAGHGTEDCQKPEVCDGYRNR